MCSLTFFVRASVLKFGRFQSMEALRDDFVFCRLPSTARGNVRIAPQAVMILRAAANWAHFRASREDSRSCTAFRFAIESRSAVEGSHSVDRLSR